MPPALRARLTRCLGRTCAQPYDFYSLPFCKPETVFNHVENLGEVLHGSVITNSPYDIFMGKSDFKVLCRVELTKKTSALLAQRIKEVRAPPPLPPRRFCCRALHRPRCRGT